MNWEDDVRVIPILTTEGKQFLRQNPLFVSKPFEMNNLSQKECYSTLKEISKVDNQGLDRGLFFLMSNVCTFYVPSISITLNRFHHAV